MTESTKQRPPAKRTENGTEFYLHRYGLESPDSEELIPVHFIVLQATLGAEPVSTAGANLFFGAKAGAVPWELFAAAHCHAKRHPARRRRGYVPRLSSETARRVIRRQWASQEEQNPRDGDGQHIITLREALRHLNNRIDQAAADDIDVPGAFTYAEFGDADQTTRFRFVPAFAEWAREFTEEFSTHEDIVAREALDDGTVVYNYSGEWSEQFLARAKADGVELDGFLGSRVIAQALEGVFAAALKEVEQEFPALWANIHEPGHRLHRFFYETHEAAAGNIMCYPKLDDEGELGFLASDPVRLAAGFLRRPHVDHLLETAAFDPSNLPTLQALVSAASSTVRGTMESEPSRGRAGAVASGQLADHVSYDQLAEQLAREETNDGLGPTSPEPLQTQSHVEEGINLASILSTLVQREIISTRELKVLAAIIIDKLPGLEVAQMLGYSSKSAVSRAKRNALDKIRSAAEDDTQIADLLRDMEI